MAITKIEFPTTGTPITSTDYTKQNELIANLINLNHNRVLTNWENTGIPMIKQGSVISYADNLYIVDTSDYTILSAPGSDGTYYVKITDISATQLQAEWVSSKSGYTWNESRNGWYNVDDLILSELITKTGPIYENQKWINQFLDHFSFSENGLPIFKITDDSNSSFYMQKVVDDAFGISHNQYFNGSTWVNPIAAPWSAVRMSDVGISFYSGDSDTLSGSSLDLRIAPTTGDCTFLSTTNSISPSTGAITATSLGLTGDSYIAGDLNIVDNDVIKIHDQSGIAKIDLRGVSSRSEIQGDSAASDSDGKILMFHYGYDGLSSLGDKRRCGIIYRLEGSSSLQRGGQIALNTASDSTSGSADRLIVHQDGEVEITSFLNVSGTIKATGGYVTKYRTDTPSETTINTESKIIEIGDWNMDSTGSINVAHNITSSLIMIDSVMIRNDTDTLQSSLMFTGESSTGDRGGGAEISGTNIVLKRSLGAGNKYDNADYNSTSYNRGWVKLTYQI